MESGRKTMEALAKKMKRYSVVTCRKIWNLGREDHRRVIHAVKVGIALTVVSLLYLTEPLFEGFGENAMWAVMTVVVVLEFTAGATLCKGINRGIGTLSAGLLAFFIEFIVTKSGTVVRGIFVAAAVFAVGMVCTYMRFFPRIKKNYDYGIVIFLLTFNLITVSSYRIDHVLKIALQRFYTIAIGCGICLIMSLLIFPIWSGEDLHTSTVSKLEGLAKSIETCSYEYFVDEESNTNKDEASDDPIYEGYKEVLDSKSKDETLALHASWEPRHTIPCYKFPGQQYIKLGGVLRHFGYTVIALHGCLQTEIQTPHSVRALFKDPCIRVAEELSKALMELADSLRKRRHCSPERLLNHMHEALKDLNTALKSQPRLFLSPDANKHDTTTLALAAINATANQKSDKNEEMSKRPSQKKVLRPSLSKIAITSLEFSEALPFAAFASLLLEAVVRLDLVIEEVEELGNIASFKEFQPNDEVIVSCEEEHAVEIATHSQNQFPS